MTRIREKSFLLLLALGFFAVMSNDPALAQHVRESVRVDTSTVGPSYESSIHCDGDLTAIAFTDNTTNGVFVSTSDGRGIAWSNPVQVDQDATSARKYTVYNSCCVEDDRICVFWLDLRNGMWHPNLFYNCSPDGGTSWTGEVLIDMVYPPDVGAIRRFDFVASGIHVYILFTVVPSVSSNEKEELYIVASHDGGQTFRAPVFIPHDYAAGTYDVDEIEITADKQTVHVVWQDKRNGNNDVFYQKSTTGGATWLPVDVQLDSSGPGIGNVEGEMSIVAIDSLVAVGWQEEYTSAYNEEVRVNVSTNGGASWNGDVKVGNYDPNQFDVDGVWLAFGSCGSATTIACTWSDDRNYSRQIYVGTSLDNGATWPHESRLSSISAGGAYPRFPRLDTVPHSLVVAFSTGCLPAKYQAAFSNDGGMSWETVQVSTTTGDIDYAGIGFSTLYNNVLCAWLSDDLGTNNVYAGGFRPQALTATGYFTGGSPVRFDISRWPTSSGYPNFCVLASGSLGEYRLPLGDNRNTGLTMDLLMTASINQIPGLLYGTIQPDGTGSTPTFLFPGSVPPGITLHFIALGLETSTTPWSLGAMTDIISVDVF